jgi:hypothetical protein
MTMEGNELITLFLGGGGLGALWALGRWYIKERMQHELDRRSWEREVEKRRDELRMRMVEHEQQAMNEVFRRFGRLSDRMADLIFELTLERPPVGDQPHETQSGGALTAGSQSGHESETGAIHAQ